MASGWTMRARGGAGMLGVAMIVMGCAAGEPGDREPTVRPGSGSAAPTHSPSSTATPDDRSEAASIPDEILDPILDDAATRIGVPAEEIAVVRAEAVTWSDGSLGCPEPGMGYTQALVDGYHVVLSAAEQELDYRVDRLGGFRVCDDGATAP
jgi:hypothetical protein